MSLLLLLSPNGAPVQSSRRAAIRPRPTRRFVCPPASGLALDNTSPAAVRNSTATADTAPFSPPAGLLVAFAIGDANNGSADEQLTITSTGGLTWTLVQRFNGAPGTTVEIWKCRVFTPPGSIIVSAADNKGNVAKSLLVRVFIDLSGRGVPDTGATAAAAGNATYVSTAPGSWGWAVGIGGSNASNTPGSGQVLVDSITGGGFDSGDNIWTISQAYLTAVQGSSVTMSVTSPPLVVHHVAVEIVPFTTPLPPATPRRPCRMPGVARRNRFTAPPWPAAQAVQPPPFVPGAPRRARLAAAQRRPRTAQVAVAAPPYPPQPVRLRVRGLRVARGRSAQPTPTVDPPPGRVRQAVTRIAVLRRGRPVVVVPTQAAPTPPAYPPQPARTRLRGVRLGRGRSAQVVPDQITVIAPPYPIQPVRTRLRGMRLARGRSAQVVPAQATVIPPAYPVPNVRTRVKGLKLARGRPAQPVPAQEVPPPPGRLRQAVLRIAALRRGHGVTPPPAQTLPPLLVRVRTRVARAFRGRQRMPVPPQIIVVPPPYPPGGHRTRRVLVLAVRRRRSVAFLDAGHSCSTPRPSTGTTARPSTGITAYNLAVTSRPSTGMTARPDTGTTVDPC